MSSEGFLQLSSDSVSKLKKGAMFKLRWVHLLSEQAHSCTNDSVLDQFRLFFSFLKGIFVKQH